jgi:hypothetical protein
MNPDPARRDGPRADRIEIPRAGRYLPNFTTRVVALPATPVKRTQ